MDREFTKIREEFKGLHRKANYVVESDKLIMALLGADPKILDRMNDKLRSTIAQAKSTEIGETPNLETQNGKNHVNTFEISRADDDESQANEKSGYDSIISENHGNTPRQIPYKLTPHPTTREEKKERIYHYKALSTLH